MFTCASNVMFVMVNYFVLPVNLTKIYRGCYRKDCVTDVVTATNNVFCKTLSICDCMQEHIGIYLSAIYPCIIILGGEPQERMLFLVTKQ